MATDRSRQILLGGLLAVAAFVIYRALASSTTSPAAPASSHQSTGARAGARGDQAAAITAPDVHLDALNSARPAPGAAERNLFRFKPKAPPPPPPSAVRTGPAVPAPSGPPPPPPGPPPPPPITLKFIGIVEQGAGKPKIAVLSDGQGSPMYGIEGATIAGRYRILRIGVESIDMAYLDGRGRQTIRLTGG